MPFSQASYDPETLKLLDRAFEDAWRQVQVQTRRYSEADLQAIRKMMALKIMDAANDGERDPERLKTLAILAVYGRGVD